MTEAQHRTGGPMRIVQRFEWDAAHRVMRHESKCATLHGHRYVAELEVEGPLDKVGRVIDFGKVKSVVGAWIDSEWDHTTMLGPDDATLMAFCATEHTEKGHKRPYVLRGEPTAENIADELLVSARDLLAFDPDLTVVRVRVWETPNCSAWAERE